MQQYCDLFYQDSHIEGDQYDQILLFVHGNISSSKYWNPVCENIYDKDQSIRLICIDLRGCGRSQSISDIDSMMDFASDIQNFVNKVLLLDEVQALSKITLVGWSLGSMVCMQLGAIWPNMFRKMILVSSGPCTGVPVMKSDENGIPLTQRCSTKLELSQNKRISAIQQTIIDKDAKMMKAIYAAVLFNSGKIPSEKDMDLYVNETFLQTNYSQVVWAIQEFDISGGKADTARLIQGPILLIHGKLDLVVNIIHAEGIKKEIGDEKCELIIRDDLGHMIPIEDPTFLANEILKFIKN